MLRIIFIYLFILSLSQGKKISVDYNNSSITIDNKIYTNTPILPIGMNSSSYVDITKNKIIISNTTMARPDSITNYIYDKHTFYAKKTFSFVHDNPTQRLLKAHEDTCVTSNYSLENDTCIDLDICKINRYYAFEDYPNSIIDRIHFRKQIIETNKKKYTILYDTIIPKDNIYETQKNTFYMTSCNEAQKDPFSLLECSGSYSDYTSLKCQKYSYGKKIINFKQHTINIDGILYKSDLINLQLNTRHDIKKNKLILINSDIDKKTITSIRYIFNKDTLFLNEVLYVTYNIDTQVNIGWKLKIDKSMHLTQGIKNYIDSLLLKITTQYNIEKIKNTRLITYLLKDNTYSFKYDTFYTNDMIPLEEPSNALIDSYVTKNKVFYIPYIDTSLHYLHTEECSTNTKSEKYNYRPIRCKKVVGLHVSK